MEQQAVNNARTQADGLDNIAPTLNQGQAAWQYAQSDNFFSPEEQTAVLRREIEPYREQLEAKLTRIGWSSAHLANHPAIENALFSGRQTTLLQFYLSPELQMTGCLRIAMTEHGPDIRVTAQQPSLTIPEQVAGIRLTETEKQQLIYEGALPRPLLIPENGQFVPTFLRLNDQTNILEFWRVKPEQLPTKLMGVDLTKDQQLQLVSGNAVRLSGLIDQQGEPFNATISLSAGKQALQFSDINRLDVALKPDTRFQEQLAQNNEAAKTDLTHSQETAFGITTSSRSQLETVQQLLAGQNEANSKGQKVRIH